MQIFSKTLIANIFPPTVFGIDIALLSRSWRFNCVWHDSAQNGVESCTSSGSSATPPQPLSPSAPFSDAP